MSRDIDRLRLEGQQSEHLQPEEELPKENDSQPRESDRQLLRLRNEVGLLRERIDLLATEQTVMRTNLSSSRLDDNSPERKKLIAQERESAIRSLEDSLSDHQQEWAKEKENYVELWKTLVIPDEILNMEPSAVLKDPRFKQYWPYFQAQRDIENHERIIDAIELKLNAEKIGRSVGQ